MKNIGKENQIQSAKNADELMMILDMIINIARRAAGMLKKRNGTNH